MRDNFDRQAKHLKHSLCNSYKCSLGGRIVSDNCTVLSVIAKFVVDWEMPLLENYFSPRGDYVPFIDLTSKTETGHRGDRCKSSICATTRSKSTLLVSMKLMPPREKPDLNFSMCYTTTKLVSFLTYSFFVHPFNFPVCAFFRNCLFPNSECTATTFRRASCRCRCLTSVAFEHLSLFLFFLLSFTWALWLNDRFSFYFVNSLKEEESAPQMPLSKAHPSEIYMLPTLENWQFQLLRYLFSRFFLFPFPISFFFRSLSFSFLFSIPVTFDRETNSSRHERFYGTSNVFLLRGYSFRFRSSTAHAIPCQSQGSARLNATSSTNRRRSQQNVERLLTFYDSGTKLNVRKVRLNIRRLDPPLRHIFN